MSTVVGYQVSLELLVRVVNSSADGATPFFAWRKLKGKYRDASIIPLDSMFGAIEYNKDILGHIMEFLPVDSFLPLLCVNLEWNDFIEKLSEEYWSFRFAEEGIKKHPLSISYLDDVCQRRFYYNKLKNTWRRFSNYLESTFDNSLMPGASEQLIQSLEAALGHPLPLPLRSSFLVHNGQYKYSQPIFFPRLFSVEEATDLFRVDRVTYDYFDIAGLILCPVSNDVGVDVFTGQVYKNVRPYGFPTLAHQNWIQYLTVY